MAEQVIVICGEEVAAYGFPDNHPFGPDRHDAFMAELEKSPRIGDVIKQRARVLRWETRRELPY